MKNLMNIGSILNKSEQKKINGGTGESTCEDISCPNCYTCKIVGNVATCVPDPTQICF